MLSMNPGDIIQTSSVRAKMFRPGESKAAMTADFSAGRGNSFCCLFLGSKKDGNDVDPEVMLNALGWVFDPDRAHKLVDEKLTEDE